MSTLLNLISTTLISGSTLITPKDYYDTNKWGVYEDKASCAIAHDVDMVKKFSIIYNKHSDKYHVQIKNLRWKVYKKEIKMAVGAVLHTDQGTDFLPLISTIKSGSNELNSVESSTILFVIIFDSKRIVIDANEDSDDIDINLNTAQKLIPSMIDCVKRSQYEKGTQEIVLEPYTEEVFPDVSETEEWKRLD